MNLNSTAHHITEDDLAGLKPIHAGQPVFFSHEEATALLGQNGRTPEYLDSEFYVFTLRYAKYDENRQVFIVHWKTRDEILSLISKKTSKRLADAQVNMFSHLTERTYDSESTDVMTDNGVIAMELNRFIRKYIELKIEGRRSRKEYRGRCAPRIDVDLLTAGMVIKSDLIASGIKERIKDPTYALSGDLTTLDLQRDDLFVIDRITPHTSSENPYKRTIHLALREFDPKGYMSDFRPISFDAGHVSGIFHNCGHVPPKVTALQPAFLCIKSYALLSDYSREHGEKPQLTWVVQDALKKTTIQNGCAYYVDEIIEKVIDAMVKQGVIVRRTKMLGTDPTCFLGLNKHQVRRVQQYVRRHAHCFKMEANLASNIHCC